MRDRESRRGDPRCIHAQAIKSKIASEHRFLFHELITHYSKSNKLSYAQRVFNQIPEPNVVSWTALISSYINTSNAFHHFISMLRHPTLPNQRTLAPLFKTCASLSTLQIGIQLHSVSLKLSLCNLCYTGSSLISFYTKCSLPNEALKVFDKILERDEVCYSSMIVGLAQNSQPSKALKLFSEMNNSSTVSSNMYGISGALRATAELAALEQCKIIHAHTILTGFQTYLVVGNALVDAYGKCGLIADSRNIFNQSLPNANIFLWNSMMGAYAQQGDKKSVIKLFYDMKLRGFSPDEYSFLALLTACSNSGSVHEAEKWLSCMKDDYGVEPQLQHYTCFINAMARDGRIAEAKALAMKMPFEADAAVWRSLLTACAVHGASEVAQEVTQRLLQHNPRDDSAFVLLANVNATAGKWAEVAEVRKLMRRRGVRKEGGMSWIEFQGEVHVFLAGDRNHERMNEIYAKLAELREEIKKLGYKEAVDEKLHEMEAADKRELLWSHSEKLALAFGVVSGAAPPGKALRILKNLRICKDCHEAFKCMSIVIKREIVVRDVNRYHRFVHGNCNCGDYW
ncbi:putative pentatricopeptide repeat-containing protein At5g52630 [Papaver somniferum]|uniref:putative pentatricopeptide repeat-containing protein At5g52630 n=1 Tax=Papaver somniferum TaxID=3469 RepID=UPI000E6FFA24|nr:putative pentatricopeptide repeat-containing protein At5g52630 [Papaver somniferum]